MNDAPLQPPIGNVPTARARALVGDMVAEAMASSDPERYWMTLLCLASSAMAAHVSHDAVIRAHTTLIETAQQHANGHSCASH